MCCFVLLIPTPEEYRVPRVNPGVTASKLFPPLLPSLATPGPPLPYRPLQNIPVLLSEVQSGVQHLLGLISGLRRGGRGIPISSLVVEMDRVVSVVFGLWRVCFPPCLVRPDRRRLVYFSIAHRRGGRSLEAIQLRKHKFLPCK